MPASGSASRRQWSSRRNHLGRWRYNVRGFFWRSWMIQKSATCIWWKINWEMIELFSNVGFPNLLSSHFISRYVFDCSLSLYVEIYAACDWTFSRLWAPSLLCRYRSAGGELGRAPCHTDERLCPTGQSVSRKILKVLDFIGSPSGYFRYDKPGLVNDQFERKAKLALNPLVWSFLRSTHGIQKVLFHCLVFLKKQPILF